LKDQAETRFVNVGAILSTRMRAIEYNPGWSAVTPQPQVDGMKIQFSLRSRRQPMDDGKIEFNSTTMNCRPRSRA
jgi:hypothetical protein